jgi:hypothetical protein
MTDNEVSHEIIGAAIEVHRLLGPGLLESAYEECLSKELGLRNLRVEAIILTYLRLSGHRLGLLINFNVNVLKDGIKRYII